MSDLVAAAEKSGIACFIGSGDSVETSTLYYAWRPIIEQILGSATVPHTPDATSRVLRQLEALQPELIPLGPLLGATLSLDMPDSELTRQMTGKTRGENTRQMLQQLVAHVAQNSRRSWCWRTPIGLIPPRGRCCLTWFATCARC